MTKTTNTMNETQTSTLTAAERRDQYVFETTATEADKALVQANVDLVESIETMVNTDWPAFFKRCADRLPLDLDPQDVADAMRRQALGTLTATGIKKPAGWNRIETRGGNYAVKVKGTFLFVNSSGEWTLASTPRTYLQKASANLRDVLMGGRKEDESFTIRDASSAFDAQSLVKRDSAKADPISREAKLKATQRELQNIAASAPIETRKPLSKGAERLETLNMDALAYAIMYDTDGKVRTQKQIEARFLAAMEAVAKVS